MVGVCLNWQLVVPFYTSTSSVWEFKFLHTSYLIFGMVSLFNCNYSNRYVIFFLCSFNLHFLNGIENIFLYLFGIHISSLLKFQFKCCAHFYWTLGLLIIEVYEIYIYSGYKSFAGYVFWQYCLPVCDLPFHFLYSTHWIFS